MAAASGYIRLQNGTNDLFWNEIDNQGTVVPEINQFLGWDDWTVYQKIFYIEDPPSTPVIPPPSTNITESIKRENYFQSERVRVFLSDRTRVFSA